MGIEQDAREGQAFDRELQEKLKADRIAEREGKRKAQEKEQKKRAKEAKKREKERKKTEKKAAKAAKKEAIQKAKVEPFCGCLLLSSQHLLVHFLAYSLLLCQRSCLFNNLAAIYLQPECAATSTGNKQD